MIRARVDEFFSRFVVDTRESEQLVMKIFRENNLKLAPD